MPHLAYRHCGLPVLTPAVERQGTDAEVRRDRRAVTRAVRKCWARTCGGSQRPLTFLKIAAIAAASPVAMSTSFSDLTMCSVELL